MLLRQFSELRLISSNICVTQKCFVHHHKERHDLERFIGLKRSNTAKANRNTHMNEKLFRRARAQKTLLLDLPEDSEIRLREKMSPTEIRYSFLKKGVNPYKDVSPRTWNEHQATFQSFYGVMDSYVKPKYVIQTDPNPPAIKEPLYKKITERGSKAWFDFKATRRIRKKVGLESFSKKLLPPVLDGIYINAHKALVNRDKNQLHSLITEHAFAKMWPDVEKGSVFWELVRFTEPTQVISVRCGDNPHKSGNDIAQVIARIHSVQKLAIYDRFGKLILGSETEEKDSLEFVVFENHVSSEDGEWRLHDKVYPSGIGPKQGPIDQRIIESLPVDEEQRPTASVPLKLRAWDKTKEGLKEKPEE
jgi:large subunit ribosomal protein L45